MAANPLNVSIKVTGLDQAKADLQAFATIGKRSFDQIAQEAKNFAQSAATTDPAMRGVANRVRQLAAASDEAFSSNLKLRQSLSDVERALRAEMVSAESAAQMTATLRAEHGKLANSTRAVVVEIRQLETISKASYGTITAMAQRAATAIEPTAQSTHNLAVAMKELSLAADPAAAAQMRLLNGLTQVQAALQQKIISTQQAVRLEQYLREESQKTARAEAELENATRNAAAARAQASIQAANAQKAASQIAIVAIQAEMREREVLGKQSFNQIAGGIPIRATGSRSVTNVSALAAQVGGLAAKADPLGTANLELRDSLLAVQRARQLTLIGEEQEAKIISYLTLEHEKYIATLNKEAGAHKTTTGHMNTATQSASKLTSGLTQLSFQVNDIATSLASGASPFMVLAQQGGQIFQIFQIFPGLFAKVAALLTNPFIAGGVAIAAVGAAFAFLINRAGEAEARLRTYDVALKGLSGTSEATAQDLEDVAKGLQHTGSTAEDAQKAVLAFARTPLVNKEAASEITNLARDISAATGRDFAQLTQDIAKAIGTDTEAVIKLVRSLAGPNGLSEATASAMKELARIGDPSGAARLGIKSLQEQFGGSFNASLSDGQKSINSISAAWDNMLTKLQNTTVITAARDAVIGMLNGIAAAAAGQGEKPFGDQSLLQALMSKFLPDTGAAQKRFVTQYGAVANAPSLAPGGAISGSLSAANTLSKDIAGLNAELQARLDRYFQDFPAAYIASAAREGSHPSRFNQSGYGLHNKDILGLGVAADIGGLNQYDPNLAKYGLRQNVPGDWRHVEPVEVPSAASATAAARMEAARRFNALYPTATTSPLGPTAPAALPLAVGGALAPRPMPTEAPLVPAGLTQEQLSILKEGVRTQDLLTASVKAFGTTNNEAQIYLKAYNAAMVGVEDTEYNRTVAMQKANGEIERHRITLQQAGDTQRLTNDLAIQTAKLFGEDEVAGYQAAAAAAAQLADRHGELADASLILNTQSAEANLATAKALPGLVQQTKASERLAEAAKGGAAAEHEMALQNQVTSATHDALTKAIASGNPKLIEQAKNLRALTEAQIRQNDAAQQNLAIRQRMTQRTDQAAIIAQQTEMVGQLPENIEAANARLTEQQKLLAAGKSLTEDISVASLRNVDALNKANIAHAEALRQQQRIDSMYQQIGSTIESAIGSVLDSIFDPKKAMDWGAQIKNMLKSLVTGIASNMFIKPLTGTILGTLGASQNVVSQYGSFGSVGTFGGGGLFKELGIDTGTSGGGLFGGTSSFFSGIGSKLGFATSVPGLSEGSIASLGDLIGIEPSSLGYLSQAGTIPGSLFGSTTLGGAIGSVGLGFTAGTMLNSVMGGKSTGGMIGSGLGSLAGMALGSMIGMPWLGALLGGAGGGLLGGMFGNSKKSNQSAGGLIDLSQFRITSGFTGGNQQIDQQMQQMGQSLQAFLDLLKTTGGKLSGNVLLQSGVNTGITADSTLPGYAGKYSLGKDTDAALKVIEQALVRSITDVGETMRTVLDQVGLDEDIQKAITFANTYDALKTAAESAFATVEEGQHVIGPFQTAMEQIQATFDDLTVSAQRFGLALEPIGEALTEATRRLQGDFLKAVDKAVNEATGKGFLNELQKTLDDYIASTTEASAIGLTDRATGDKLGTLFMAQINSVLEGLTDEELNTVIASFQGLNDTIAQLAVTAQSTNEDVNDLADALATRATAAFASIQEYIDRLTGTASTTVSPESALIASQAQYAEQLAKAQGGDIVALEGITQTADQLVQAIGGYYGSTQAGADLTAQIVAQLQALVGGTEPIHVDPVVQQLVVISGAIGDGTDALNTGISNIIGQNVESALALMAINDRTAAEAVSANLDNTEALIAGAQQQTTDLIASNDNATADLIAKNTLDTTNLINTATGTTNDIITQQNINSGALISSGALSTSQILAQADAASAESIATAEAAAADIIAQNTAAADQLVANGQWSTSQIMAQADAASAESLAAGQSSTAALIAQNDNAKLALVTTQQTATAQLLSQAESSSAAALATAQAGSDSIIGTIAAWSAAIYGVIEAYGSATVNALGGSGVSQTTAIYDAANSINYTIGVWSQIICDHIRVYESGIIDTLNAWLPAQISAISNSANSINYTIGLWSQNICDHIRVYETSVVNTIAAWAPLQLTATYDSAQGVSNTIAAWVSAQMSNDTNNANGVISTIASWGSFEGSNRAGWVSAQMNNDTALINSLINTTAVYSNGIISAVYGGASSIIAVEANYAASNEAWQRLLYDNGNRIYDVLAAEFNLGLEQRNTMIYLLQSIYDGLRLIGGF